MVAAARYKVAPTKDPKKGWWVLNPRGKKVTAYPTKAEAQKMAKYLNT